MMNTSNDRSRSETGGKLSDSMKSNIAMLMFGVATLMFLIAIDHKEWFTLRPVSGSAVAISYVSDHEAARRNVEAATGQQEVARP